MMRRFTSTQSGLTIVETIVGGMVASAVGLAAFAFLNAGMYLSAKNVSLNMTSNQMRGALDRVENVLNEADTDPVVIDTTGSVSSGWSAGIRFDLSVDGPYVADKLTTVSGSTSVKLTRSASSLIATGPDSLASMVGNVIRFDGTDSTFRPRIGSAPSGSGTTLVTYTCPLLAGLSRTVVPTTGDVLTAKLVRQVAFIVMPNGAKRELRYYHSFEGTTNLNDTTKYFVITDQIGTQAADLLPFRVDKIGGKNFINFTLRVRSVNSDYRLANKQLDEFNTFGRLDSYLRAKNRTTSE